MGNDNIIFSINEASKFIGVSRQTLYNWIKAGKLIPLRFLNKPYIPIQVANQLKKSK